MARRSWFADLRYFETGWAHLLNDGHRAIAVSAESFHRQYGKSIGSFG